MTWRIPPLGYCAVCISSDVTRKPAMTLFGGTSVCAKHLHEMTERCDVVDENFDHGYSTNPEDYPW